LSFAAESDPVPTREFNANSSHDAEKGFVLLSKWRPFEFPEKKFAVSQVFRPVI
jgi:hypothetical protein